ncbi:hypothetical protein [Flavobacterium muglaense]|uniref:Major capsid protein n=1 Tax=Flavobacterium muglaense TaxID=2764716 RepID=A0A923MXA9_9FLAO|nr:hypothetical protein [Flavobacterium muglaense]MBC5836794.1 hypothetical protein [Flavobacterium muglaense]MBC5843256.1 hypothetical protein [Flavobacterium muglaense]
MAYSVSSLTDYVNEQNFPILKASVLGAKTASIFTLQTGIKSSAALNIMAVDAKLQDDSVGASTDGGSNVTFSQRLITVAPIAVREFFDPKLLNAKYLQSQIKSGSADNELVFEAELMEEVVKVVNKKNEVALWQGDTSLTGSTDLMHYDGYLKLLDTASASTTNVTAATFTSSNAIAFVDAVYTAIPVEVLDADDMAIYMGREYFRTYTTALKNANLFHYGADSTDGEIVIPGTQIKIYALNGLNSTKRVVAGRKSNFYVGCDLDGEEDNASAVYIDQTERVKLKIAYKYGAQVAFPAEIVVGRVSA